MSQPSPKMPPLARSLSVRLLVLTIFFVMVAEVLIFAPSIARFRLDWFRERIATAHLATLALKASPTHHVSDALERELLRHVQGYGVMHRCLMLSTDMPPHVDATVDIARASVYRLIVDAFATLARGGNRVLKVIGPSPMDPHIRVAVVLDEAPLRHEMWDFAKRILILSIVISLFTAGLVYLSLHRLLVRPMRRITASMVAFREDPESPTAAVAESGRGDEIGTAEHELVAMQRGLRAALRQKQHLAALGEAVAKINHDLRNMLSTAGLVSERLAQSGDPEVKRALPTLERALDRAVALCTQTLRYVQEPAALDRRRFDLGEMVREALPTVPQVAKGRTEARIEIPDGLVIHADRAQLFRAFANLAKNAAEAGAGAVTVRLVDSGGGEPGAPIVIDIADNGPGLNERARQNLFRPFAGAGRSGGTGLGLAIAREVMVAHGGTLALATTGAEGTVFRLTVPAGAKATSKRRRVSARGRGARRRHASSPATDNG